MKSIRNILIIEDNPIDAKLVQFHLEKSGMNVTHVVDPLVGIELMQKQVYDLILLDWNLPHLSGMDVLKHLRSTVNKGEDPLPVIIISGRNESKHVKQAVETGATDYIIKPIDLMILEDKIQKVLAKKQDWAFHHLPTPAAGFMKVELKICALNEVGALIASSVPLRVGQTLPIESALLVQNGIPNVYVRVLGLEKVNGEELYTCGFVGLKEGELKKIRLLIRAQQFLDQTI
jgi:CheY-like chemotaxis protein